jgi:hypothetical protein
MLTRLLCRIERVPSWLEYVFVRDIGSNEEPVEAEPLLAACSIVATDMSACCCFVRFDLSRALETRKGTSEPPDEFIYSYEMMCRSK